MFFIIIVLNVSSQLSMYVSFSDDFPIYMPKCIRVSNKMFVYMVMNIVALLLASLLSGVTLAMVIVVFFFVFSHFSIT